VDALRSCTGHDRAVVDKKSATRGITPGLHRHLMWSMIGQVLVVTLALATGAIAPWPAALLIAAALSLAAHCVAGID